MLAPAQTVVPYHLTGSAARTGAPLCPACRLHLRVRPQPARRLWVKLAVGILERSKIHQDACAGPLLDVVAHIRMTIIH